MIFYSIMMGGRQNQPVVKANALNLKDCSQMHMDFSAVMPNSTHALQISNCACLNYCEFHTWPHRRQALKFKTTMCK